MREKITEILGTRTVRESGITFIGTFLNGALGLLFYILIARYLGPASFGIFSVSVAALTLVSDIASLGTDTGIVRFVGKYYLTDKVKALRFLKISLEVKIIVWLLVSLLGWLLVPFVAGVLLAKSELVLPLRIAMLGVGSGLLFAFTTNALQAIQRFWVWSILNVLANSIRLLFLFLAFYLAILSPESGIGAYIAAPFIGFLVGFFFLPNFLGVKGEKSVASELFHYNKWVALFILIAAVSSRLDTFLVTRILTLKDVGIYSVASSLSGIVPQIVYAIGAVVAPKLAGFDNKDKAISYLTKLQLFVSFLCVVGIAVGIPLAYLIIPQFYGPAYLPSIGPFIILLFAQAIFLFSVPAHTSVFYYFARPSLFVWISLGHLMIIGGLGYILISQLSYTGAALTVLIGTIFNFVVPATWVLYKFRQK